MSGVLFEQYNKITNFDEKTSIVLEVFRTHLIEKQNNLSPDIIHAVLSTAKNAEQFEMFSNNALLLVLEHSKYTFNFTYRT